MREPDGVAEVLVGMAVPHQPDLVALNPKVRVNRGWVEPWSPAWNFAKVDSEVLLDGYIPPDAIRPFTQDLWSGMDGC